MAKRERRTAPPLGVPAIISVEDLPPRPPARRGCPCSACRDERAAAAEGYIDLGGEA